MVVQRDGWRRRYKDGDIGQIQTETQTETTATTEMTALNKSIPNCQRERRQAHEYKTPGVSFYLLSVQYISQNESIISII